MPYLVRLLKPNILISFFCEYYFDISFTLFRLNVTLSTLRLDNRKFQSWWITLHNVRIDSRAGHNDGESRQTHNAFPIFGFVHQKE